ncbi:MAG: UDP binding domain-containing protein, partial [Bdellovibrionota bacterium]
LSSLQTAAALVAETHGGATTNDQPLIFAINSQVPVGFGGMLEKRFGFSVAYIPENLRLGKGMETFLSADRTVIGANRTATRQRLHVFLAGLKTQFLLCDLVTSEMIKHATNAFLATSISFANQLARIGESVGADNQIVGQALKLDGRIGSKAYVSPGLGFAGGTLPRDLRVLQQIGASNRISTPLVDAVFEINETTTRAISHTLHELLDGLTGRKIVLLGYSYKAETDTFRRSPSLALAQELNKAGAVVAGYDPMMNARDLAPLAGLIQHQSTWDAVLKLGADAVVVMTARPEFRSLEWSRFRGFVFDTISALDPDPIVTSGIPYKALWQHLRRPENK